MSPSNPYVPTNMPAVGDLFDMFDFGAFGDDNNQGGNDQGCNSQGGNSQGNGNGNGQ
jgi:phospholipase C